MEDIRITVLTDPVPVGIEVVLTPLRKIARRLKRFFYPAPHFTIGSIYRGHPAVTRSLVEGLRKIGVKVNYNPLSLRSVANIVVVPGGISALRQSINLKKAGVIKKLLAGPNMVTYPHEHNYLVSNDAIDAYLAPCELTVKFCITDAPELGSRCISWPAGVDTDYWVPKNDNRKKVIFYIKKCKFYDPEVFQNLNVQRYIDYVSQSGYDLIIINYGEYTVDFLRKSLDRAILMIVFTYEESQGLAWAQAWSMDVPTLIFYNDRYQLNGKLIECSTAPYLTDDTGMFFKDFEDFKENFQICVLRRRAFSPRQWVLDHMSDEKCAEHILRIIQGH